MNKIIITHILICFCTINWLHAQPNSISFEDKFDTYDLPFSNFINMSDAELREIGFSYIKRKNVYSLKNHSGNTIAESIISGYNIRKETDYEIYIYMGETGKAIIQICFYSPFVYSALVDWIYR